MKKPLAVLLTLILSFAIFSCAPTEAEHKHVEQTVFTECEDGLYDITQCENCGKIISKTLRYSKTTEGIFRNEADKLNFYITSAAGLLNFAAILNGQSNGTVPRAAFKGKTFALLNDIDMIGEEWPQIEGESFISGITFDGNGKIIKNLTVVGNESVGFIKTVTEDLTIKNLTFENADVTVTGKWGGILIGDHASGTVNVENVNITDSAVKGSIQSLSIRLGALVGFSRLDGGAKIYVKSCSVVNSEFTGYHTTCGLIGTLTNYGSYESSWSISGCSVKNNKFNIGTGVQKYVSPFAVDGGSYPERSDNDAYFINLGNSEENNTFVYSLKE